MTLAIAFGIILAVIILAALIFALPLLRWLAVIAWIAGLFLSPAIREVTIGIGIVAAATVAVWIYAARQIEQEDP
jgi:hypothetical protein